MSSSSGPLAFLLVLLAGCVGAQGSDDVDEGGAAVVAGGAPATKPAPKPAPAAAAAAAPDYEGNLRKELVTRRLSIDKTLELQRGENGRDSLLVGAIFDKSRKNIVASCAVMGTGPTGGSPRIVRAGYRYRFGDVSALPKTDAKDAPGFAVPLIHDDEPFGDGPPGEPASLTLVCVAAPYPTLDIAAQALKTNGEVSFVDSNSR